MIKKEITDNLAYTFFNNLYSEESKKISLSVLKILDFDYNFEKGELIYEGCSPSLVYSKNEWEKLDLHLQNKITPYPIKSFDIECIETALNSNKVDAPKASPILDAIGWIIRLEVDKFKIHFTGSPSWEVWKEPAVAWDYDIEPDAIDWKTGNDWNDHWDIEKDIPKNWLEDFEG